MKLEVGMYVRTKHNGIGKIIDYINDPTHYFFKCYKLDKDYINYEEYITEADVIGKPSFDIIDLIEVGDYVNGTKVNRLKKDYIVIHEIWSGREYLSNEEIKTIVTKEQFEQIGYKLKEMK